MRRSTTTALSLGAVFTALALTGCAEPDDTSAATPARPGGSTASASVPLSSAQLNKRLLNVSDLGEGHTRKPETPRHNDDISPDLVGACLDEALAKARTAR